MQDWPDADTIRAKGRGQLMRARFRRNQLIAEREQLKATTQPRLRNMVLSAREDMPSQFARCAARFYRMAERQCR